MRLTPDEARRRFLSLPVARLATVSSDGAPRLVPIVFASIEHDGREALVHAVDHKPKSTTGLARLADIATEPAGRRCSPTRTTTTGRGCGGRAPMRAPR